MEIGAGWVHWEEQEWECDELHAADREEICLLLQTLSSSDVMWGNLL